MTAKNDITGARIVSRVATDSYRLNWDNIFGESQNSKSMKEKTVNDESTSNADLNHKPVRYVNG
jgi:hypothetical protein